jgi:hypothetical protein
MASRNNLNTFAWVCALVLPFGLQLIAGFQEDVRDYLGGYYGPFTLYFFFVMTYGLATIFVSFYQLSGYRRQGTLDMLRITQTSPGELLRDVYLQLQRVLLPPILGFGIAFVIYTLASTERDTIMGLGGTTLAGGVLNVVLTEMLLCALMCLGLLRSEGPLALLATLFVLPLNIFPIALMFAAERLGDSWKSIADSGGKVPRAGELVTFDPPLLLEWFVAAPWVFYILGAFAVLALLLWGARARVAQLWPPQLKPLKGG